MAHVLILGCGYTGERLALRLLEEDHRVTGSTRSRERAEELRDLGVEPVLLDVSDPESVRDLSGLAPDVVFYLIPPLRDADEPGREVGGVIDVLGRAPVECFVYVSSTSVYGDRGGERVDETDEPRPDSSTGRARLTAERTVLEKGWSRDARPRIARVAGIYGPGRTLRERIREGRYQLLEDADAVTNRIHVEDLVTGLVAVWREGRNGRIYNLADGHPLPSSEYARITADHLGVDLPTISVQEARERYSPGRLARKLGSKRVENRRLREELGVELRYPSVREGLPAALRAEETGDEGKEAGGRA
ncbi:MAG: SDR family oxidoreductase [Candidatus Palauibacterales bacterium]|nr:SDR family oxidoreductase [Candidatus Palauibacterales bacterium]